jgi:hypothetical protein
MALEINRGPTGSFHQTKTETEKIIMGESSHQIDVLALFIKKLVAHGATDQEEFVVTGGWKEALK